MRYKVLTGTVLLASALALTACSEGSGSSTASSTMAPSSSSQAMTAAAAGERTGTFGGLNDKHVAGTAELGGGTLTLSGFSADEAPDLHVYLTNGTDESAVSAGRQLGKVAYDSASQTFSVTEADAATYSTVVIHCDKAKAVFGAATLS